MSSAGEINNGLSGGQEAMDKVARYSEDVHTKLGGLVGRFLEFAETLDGIKEYFANLSENDEAVAAQDSARTANEEAQAASRAIGSKLQGATNPKANLITGLLTALAEATDITERNTRVIIEAVLLEGNVQESLGNVAGLLREIAGDLGATAEESSVQAELARTTKQAMGEYSA